MPGSVSFAGAQEKMPCREAVFLPAGGQKRFPGSSAGRGLGRLQRRSGVLPPISGMRLDQIQFRPGFLEHVLPVLLERGIGEHGFDIADIGHPDHGGTAEFGIVRALLPAGHEWQGLLGKILMEMMAVMSHVATPSAIRDKNPNKISDDLVLVCEEQIDALSAKMEENGNFILPGVSLVSAHLQMARTILRRADRRQ